MTNTPSGAPVTAADVAAAYLEAQRTSRAQLKAARSALTARAMLDGGRLAQSIRAALEAGGPMPPDALALADALAAGVAAADAAIAAGDAAIAAGEAAIALFERTPPDVFAAGMRLAFDAARGEA